MDAGVPSALVAWTKAFLADAKACGPGPPMLGLSLRVMTFRRRRQSKPGLRGERVISVNTIAQGMSVVSAALSLLACAKCTFLCTQGSRVRPAPGIPCALLLSRATDDASLGHEPAAGIWKHAFRHAQHRSPGARSDTRESPACRCAHAGYGDYLTGSS